MQKASVLTGAFLYNRKLWQRKSFLNRARRSTVFYAIENCDGLNHSRRICESKFSRKVLAWARFLLGTVWIVSDGLVMVNSSGLFVADFTGLSQQYLQRNSICSAEVFTVWPYLQCVGIYSVAVFTARQYLQCDSIYSATVLIVWLNDTGIFK